MMYLIKKILFVLFILAAAYIPVRDQIPADIRNLEPFQYVDEGFDTAVKFAGKFLGPENYYAEIQEISAEALLTKIRDFESEKSGKVGLIYIYTIGCDTCAANFVIINNIAGGYRSDKIVTFSVAVEDNRKKFAEFLKFKNISLDFVPYMLKKSEHSRMGSGLIDMGASDYRKPPYVAIIDPQNSIGSINTDTGPYVEKRIRERLDPYLGNL